MSESGYTMAHRGIFGMNFEHIPLEQIGYGVWLIFAVMLALILGLLSYFRHQRWL